MIGKVSGTLLEKQPPQVLVDVGGIGYEIDVPMSTFYNLPATGNKISLYTQVIVREDAHLLFGFASERERSVFRQLIKVSGVGAKMALALLSGLSVDELAHAVVNQDAGRLTKIPGIGKKTAERLLLELRDRLGAAEISAVGVACKGVPGNDIMSALLALGYNEREASRAVAQVPQEADVSDGIRQALKLLSRA